MQAIVLAGGFGKRLAHVVSDVPKPMAPINGTPFLQILLDDLIDKGFTKIILATGYKKEVIRAYFKDSYRNVEIIYSEENEPLGTGGAIVQALKFITTDFVFVLNGDTYFDVDFQKMKSDSKLSMAVKFLENTERYGGIRIKDGKVIEFVEKNNNNTSGFINGGIYYLNKSYLLEKKLPINFSFEKDILEKEYKTTAIKAIKFDDYFIDIGIPEDYYKFIRDYGNE